MQCIVVLSVLNPHYKLPFCLDTLYLRDDYNFLGHLPNSYSMCEDASFEVILPLLESQLI